MSQLRLISQEETKTFPRRHINQHNRGTVKARTNSLNTNSLLQIACHCVHKQFINIFSRLLPLEKEGRNGFVKEINASEKKVNTFKDWGAVCGMSNHVFSSEKHDLIWLSAGQSGE
jgi:hypothetical protein